MAKNKKDVRARTWTFILYPESAPENWRDILDGYHIPWVESPLHDKDVNPDGTVKKAHRHVILLFDGKKSFEQVKDITDALNAPIPQKTANTKGLVRYLIHMDNPEKHQYKREDIICHSGADIEQYFEISSASRERILWDIMEFIRDEKITSYSAFIGYCQDTNNREWFSIATRYYTLAIRTLIDSVYQDQKEPKNNISDTIADNVRKVKELSEKGYSQRKIADTLGIGLATVNRYLKR